MNSYTGSCRGSPDSLVWAQQVPQLGRSAMRGTRRRPQRNRPVAGSREAHVVLQRCTVGSAGFEKKNSDLYFGLMGSDSTVSSRTSASCAAILTSKPNICSKLNWQSMSGTPKLNSRYCIIVSSCFRFQWGPIFPFYLVT